MGYSIEKAASDGRLLQIGVVKAIFARMGEPKTIDHDPDEPPLDRTGNWPYWVGFILLAVLWIGNLALFTLDWHSVALGALTGGVFVGFILDYTGNRLPRWMRR